MLLFVLYIVKFIIIIDVHDLIDPMKIIIPQIKMYFVEISKCKMDVTHSYRKCAYKDIGIN